MGVQSPYLSVINSNELVITLDGIAKYAHIVEVIVEIIRLKGQHSQMGDTSPYAQYDSLSVLAEEIERRGRIGSDSFSRSLFIELLCALIAYETFGGPESGSELLHDAALSFEDHFEPIIPKSDIWH